MYKAQECFKHKGHEGHQGESFVPYLYYPVYFVPFVFKSIGSGLVQARFNELENFRGSFGGFELFFFPLMQIGRDERHAGTG